MMASADRLAALRRERSMADCVPYGAQLTQHVIRTLAGDYIQVFRLGGAGFESADDVQLNVLHERLNMLWRNLATPHLAVWTHVVRRRQASTADPAADGGFASRMYRRYHERLTSQTLMVNEIYLSTVYRPARGAAMGLAARLLIRASKDAVRETEAEALEFCEKLSFTIAASLSQYEPVRLGCYQSGGHWCSAPLEFLALLIGAEVRTVPLPRSALSQVLGTSRLFFGAETIEYRTPTLTRYAAVLGIKEYPTPNAVGMYDRLLSAPFPFVLTQSFAFLSRSASEGVLQRQMHRLANAGDFALSQADELRTALDALASNEFVFGDHHCSLQVLVDRQEGEVASEAPALRLLNDRVARARDLLSATGMTVAREDLALEAAFWAQLPGNFPYRPRKAPLTSRNFAAMSAFHNYPTGRASDNHWGEALATLVSSANSPYHFSLHASDPADPQGGSRRDTGHTFICGPTGSGKTVLIGFLIAMLTRVKATQVIFDKDHGLEILVRALGGEYLPLRNGVATGFNPLQLAATPANAEFLKVWLRSLVKGSVVRPLGMAEQADLDLALHGTLALDPALRRLSRLIEFLDPTDPEGVHARLAPWCECTQGDYAWVFDHEQDSIVPRMGGSPIIGFDVTEFLDHERTRSSVTLYLFHLVRQMLDGRRLVCWMDEFWRLLADEAFENFAKDGPKTWRKLNAVMCVATQSVSDVLNSPISRTIVEQTPTKILFPNPDASIAEYMSGLGLTERECLLIRERLEPGSRQFLVKQGHHSVVCQLDLKGFDDELRVISGRASEVQRMRACRATHGDQPDAWLDAFLRRA
jgi:type IV secretion system protein VirB4